jgi:hypothetical protein
VWRPANNFLKAVESESQLFRAKAADKPSKIVKLFAGQDTRAWSLRDDRRQECWYLTAPDRRFELDLNSLGTDPPALGASAARSPLDFRYFASNVTDDALDVVTAPLLLWRLVTSWKSAFLSRLRRRLRPHRKYWICFSRQICKRPPYHYAASFRRTRRIKLVVSRARRHRC